jgi:hypothetical protein
LRYRQQLFAWPNFARRLSVEAVHLAGVLKGVADRKSHSECDSSDWMLCRDTFDGIDGTFPLRTDLFSLAWIALLPCFSLGALSRAPRVSMS